VVIAPEVIADWFRLDTADDVVQKPWICSSFS